MSKDLSELMKEATKEVHEQAENTPFMKNFQKGQVSLHEFKVLCSSFAWGRNFLARKHTVRLEGCSGGEEGDGARQEVLCITAAWYHHLLGKNMLFIKLQHPKILLAPLAEGRAGLHIPGWAVTLKQDEKTEQLMGLMQLLFSFFINACTLIIGNDS